MDKYGAVMTAAGQLTEASRQLLLQRYHILDTAPERDYDDIVQLAATICETPIALISFVDGDRIWFKARIGNQAAEKRRDSTMCDHVMALAGEIVIVADIETDERFAHRRDAFRESGMRFYAGAPLITPEGHVVGTVCVMDRVPRAFPAEKAQALAILARQVMAMLELRRHVALLQTANANLADHSMTDPLTGIPNRASFDKKLLIEGARAQRTKQNMALLLVEIAGIAVYREEFGLIAAGNACQTVAQIIAASARPYDYVARFDDNRFSIILPGTQQPEAAIVATRLKQFIAATAFPHAPLQLLTGIACVTAESDGPSLLKQAEMALLADRTGADIAQCAA
jgi:diguanylate cyclase (GGDEF)-like protein